VMNYILTRPASISGLILALALGLSATPSRAQDYLKTSQIPILVKPGYKLTVKVTCESAKEQALMIWRQSNGDRLKVMNSLFGNRDPIESPAGGGEWTSEVATEPTVIYLCGQHKLTGYDGGGGNPWLLSRFKVFFQNESGAVVGFDDSDRDDDFNDITATITLTKVEPSK
jgi:hypothetical protein